MATTKTLQKNTACCHFVSKKVALIFLTKYDCNALEKCDYIPVLWLHSTQHYWLFHQEFDLPHVVHLKCLKNQFLSHLERQFLFFTTTLCDNLLPSYTLFKTCMLVCVGAIHLKWVWHLQAFHINSKASLTLNKQWS